LLQGDEPFYIDAYERGAFRIERDLREYFHRLGTPFEPGALMPGPWAKCSPAAAATSSTNYTAARDHAKAKLFAEFVHEFELAYRRHAEPS